MSKNKSIDKMAEQFTSPEELQAYSEAQFKTILKLNEKINEQEKKIASLEAENKQLRGSVATNGLQHFPAVTNEEAACVTQIALIKENAMSRELTMDETKRLEIYVKTLQLIRNKEPGKKEQDTSKISDADLDKLMEEALKSPQ